MAATRHRPKRRRRRRVVPFLAAGVGALVGQAGRAETTLDFRFLFYGESDNRTQVLDPVVDLTQDFGRQGKLGLLLGYDSISGASPTGEAPTFDTTTSASGQTVLAGQIPQVEYRDTRKAASLSYERRFGAHLPSVDLSYSREGDYLSHGVSLADSWSLLGGRSTLHVGYGATRDVIEPVTSTERLDKQSDSYSLGWTQILGPRDLVDVSASVTRLSGYLTDPYKVVPVAGMSVPEVRPDARTRSAVVFKFGHAFYSRGALKVTYRYYTDDWSIHAHTLELVHDQRFGRNWIVTPRVRYYSQGSASFFGYEFAEPARYMSSDYRLSGFSSWLGGLGITRQLSPQLSINVGATYQKQIGSDRIVPLMGPGGALIGGREDGEGEGEGGLGGVVIHDVSPADLTTITATAGFTYRF